MYEAFVLFLSYILIFWPAKAEKPYCSCTST